MVAFIPEGTAMNLLFINCILPGIGTIIAAVMDRKECCLPSLFIFGFCVMFSFIAPIYILMETEEEDTGMEFLLSIIIVFSWSLGFVMANKTYQFNKKQKAVRTKVAL